MPRFLRLALSCLLASATLIAGAAPASAFEDVAKGSWAEASIDHVAVQNDWLRDFGRTRFEPAKRLSRRHLARAVVRALAPTEPADPRLEFTDLPSSDRFYRFANVAVKLGLMRAPNKTFSPMGRVRKVDLDRALVEALGLREEAKGLNRISTSDGYRFKRPSGFAHLILAQELELHWNDPGELRELSPGSTVRRDEAAYSLSRAVSERGGWQVSSLSRFRKIVLPAMNATRKKTVEFAFAYAGYPYVYAGEWHVPTPDPYCCGPQRRGGFDCSGFVWWAVAAPTSGWDNTKVRPYQGWALPQRSSREMAKATKTKLRYGDMKPMDVMLFNSGGDGWEGVSHAGLYLGNHLLAVRPAEPHGRLRRSSRRTAARSSC